MRQIFKMYAYENKGSMAIATWLNNHGIKRNLRGNTRGETHVVKSDGYEVYNGQHDAIIDDATWAAAQALVGTRKPNMKTHDDGHVNMLNGLLVCPVCGRKMSSKPNRGKLKKERQRGPIIARIPQKRVVPAARSKASTRKSAWTPCAVALTTRRTSSS